MSSQCGRVTASRRPFQRLTSDMTQDELLLQGLSEVVDPCSIATGVPINLIDMGMVERAECVDGVARVILRLTSPVCWQASNIVASIERKALAIEGISSLDCQFSLGSWMPDMMNKDARSRLRALRPVERHEMRKDEHV